MTSPTDKKSQTVYLDMDPLLMIVLLLLCSSGLCAKGIRSSTGARCETTAKADIMLLVDSSRSVSRLNFIIIRSFLARLVSVFDIGPDRVQIGLVQYSDDPVTEWHLNTHQTKYSLLKAIRTLPYRGGSTNTGRALDFILHNSFKPNVGMRADSQKIAVLITDGKSTDITLLPSQNLKDAGIEVYAIGVEDADENELRSIASDPDEIHMYYVNSSFSLLDIVDNLTINICNSANSLVFVKLVNGAGLCSGRLEVKSNQFDQSWSSVCEDNFDRQDAEVVCRELGCGAPSVPQGVLYGEMEAPVWTREFQCGGSESALLDCRTSDSDRNTCSSGKAVGLTCSEPVRLVGGSSRCTGTLEVKQGDWRPVDGSDWTVTSAAIACEDLGCGSAVSAGIRNESFSTSAWKINPDCIQAEYTLRQCVTSGSSSSILEITCFEPVVLVGGSSRCAGSLKVKQGQWRPADGTDWTLKEAAIVCRDLDCGPAVSAGIRYKSMSIFPWKISPSCIQAGYTLTECVTPSSSSSIMEITCLDSVRLVNGTNLCSGRLEVKSNQSNQLWSSVCEDNFDQQDAEVVCRELGCGAPSVLQGALYGEMEAPVWTREFQCGGNESALLDCRSSDSDRNTCSPGKVVGLTCSDPVRLVGGSSRCTGTLEVKRGDWRPVDGSDWNLTSAAIACKDLDCGSAVSTGIRNESFSTSAWKINPDCIQAGNTLRECVTSGSSSSILEITCLDPVRLVGGSSRCAGSLEVRRGDWRPVDGSDWTLKEAAIICRDLDCGSAVSAGIRYKSLHKSAWKISPSCIQAGSTLRECVTPGSSSSIMEITCLDSVRLVNGTNLCSGRLEVKSNQSDQSWSSVCEDDFDQQDAEVVCRELGCGAPSVPQGALYEEVEALMWTREFQCGGNESALLDCRTSDSNRNNCSSGKAVGLTCSDPVRLVGGSSRCTGTLEVKQGDWRPVDGSDWTLTSAVAFCRKLDCGSAVSAGRREDFSNRSAWKFNFDCVHSGSALRECVTSLSWSSSILELTCSHPADFIIRLVAVPLILLLSITVIYFIFKATRGQRPGPQENIEVDYYNLHVFRAEGGLAEEEGAQAEEEDLRRAHLTS